MNRLNRILVPAVSFVVLLSVGGCKKNVPLQTTATAPPIQPAPSAAISASPTSVVAGNPVVLTWQTTNASSANIAGIGNVATSGTKTITPGSSTDYRLVARGDGGTASDEVHVTVTQPVASTAAASTFDAAADFRAHMQDIFFDYDKAAIRSNDDGALTQDAAYLTRHPALKIVIGGYCDERGSDEYNMALGQSRAADTEKALIDDGVAANRIRVISYGKEKPFCSDSTESCWQKNRRAGFAIDN